MTDEQKLLQSYRMSDDRGKRSMDYAVSMAEDWPDESSALGASQSLSLPGGELENVEATPVICPSE